MQTSNTYDVAVIGGGLAGLSLSIQMARQGFSVILFEKEKYPFHKVCGEYISMEAWNFLESLGVPLSTMQLPLINTLQVTAPGGRSFITKLPLGGFGISRYTLDHRLCTLARQQGVTVLEETKVEDVHFNETFSISFTTKAGSSVVRARVCTGAFGKRSNLDVRWKRPFISSHQTSINNYIGIKYHVTANWPEHVIGLHNFKDGYCGISKVEGDRYCLCYLTTAANLKKSNHSIEQLEQETLGKNPFLKTLFASSHRKEGFPLTIAQISFSKKEQVEQHVLMLGDAAGMITPLCGNGMSMALHSSKIAAQLITDYLQQQTDYKKLAVLYQQQWQHHFGNRIAAGRLLQRFFGHEALSNFFVATFQLVPFLAAGTIKKTHGRSF